MIIENTVIELCKKFDDSKINYAVMRNYEKMPSIGHDLDLICEKNSIDKIRAIIKNIAKQYDWDWAIQDNHWQSSIYFNSITVFKLFSFSEEKYLQIDLFGGFPILAMNGLNSHELLSKKTKDNFFYRISLHDELIIRVMQLGKASLNKQDERVLKIQNILNKHEFLEFSEYFYDRLGLKLFLNSFNDKDIGKKYKKFKIIFLIRELTKHPFKAIYLIVNRSFDYLKFYLFKQPGVCITVSRDDARLVKEILKKMIEINFITHFTIVNKFSLSGWIEQRKIMERGGIVVKLTNRQARCPSLSVKSFVNELVNNNSVVYEK